MPTGWMLWNWIFMGQGRSSSTRLSRQPTQTFRGASQKNEKRGEG